MSDGSNAWDKSPKLQPEIPGVWESKVPLSYNVLVYGQHYILWFFPKAGSRINEHRHEFEHSSIILRGEFSISGDKERRNDQHFHAPDVVCFEKGTPHSLLALTDGAMCLHLYPPGLTVTDGS